MKGACALGSTRGFQSRSLNWQRRVQARELTSDGQPENLVGRFSICLEAFKHPDLKYAVCLAKGLPRGKPFLFAS